MKAFIAAVSSVCITSAALVQADGLDRAAGKALFDRIWVPAPAKTNAADGLGPLFNARSCATCHASGGPARVVRDTEGNATLRGGVVRFGDASGHPDPYYGVQLQTDAAPPVPSEGQASFLPHLTFELAGPPLSPGINAEARLAPSLAGRAALDAIDDETILKNEDVNDANRDGIRGRARRLGRDGKSGPVGRFGWKAGQPDAEHQIANALAVDLGLSNPLDPRPYGDCTPLETACLNAPNGESSDFDGREVSGLMVKLMARYLEILHPRKGEIEAAGRAVFDRIGCGVCHIPEMPSRTGSRVITFTDFLLHDMGPGLSNGAGEPGANPAEWRTAPLIDLDRRRGTRRYMHDGRSATIDEAIRQHGGESSSIRAAYEKLKAAERRQLIDYLEGL